MEKIENNIQKYQNYKEQFGRLNKALKQGFHLEAMFIEYAIIEDRSESILRHAGKWDGYVKKQKGRFPTIDSKLKYILKQAENKKDLIHRYFSDELISRILAWKDKRNQLIHALLKQKLSSEEITQISSEGYELVKEFRNRAAKYTRRINNEKKQEINQ